VGPDGVPLFDHLLSAWRQSGQMPGALEGPECPDVLRHLMEWFLELSSARGSSGFGINPIGYPDIEAWSRLTGARPSPYEVECLLALDRAFLQARAEKTKT